MGKIKPRKINFSFKIVLIVFILSLFSGCNKKIISLKTSLEEMVNKTAITHFPKPEYSLKQFSSYDRKSISPYKMGWFANEDWTQFIRVEKNNGHREFVLFDADGPGAIVRFWMTFSGEGASDGILRIYIDGKKEPEIEGRPLKLLSGGVLAPAPLSTSVPPEADYSKRGHNLYLPIPYAKHCKVTYESDIVRFEEGIWKPSIYYNINYRTYERGTKIKSFSKKDLVKLKKIIKKTASILLNPNVKYKEKFEKSRILLPSKKLSLNIFEKNRAISKIQVKIDAKDISQALRSTVLKISFDDHDTVWVPVGEFFGSGYEIRPSKTWYTRVGKEGLMEATWLMPFKRQAKVWLINYGEQKVKINLNVFTSKYKWKKNSLYFGASWHEYHGVSTASKPDLDNDEWHYDLNYVELKGKGVYVGDSITIFNTVGIWWGEGDEKIYVDGEKFPSSFGTGTEDYYGYAWCRPEEFTHPFIAQPSGEGNDSVGMTVNLRYRSLDAIPFKEKISSNIELWHWVKTRLNYAMTAFWYVKDGFKSNISPGPELVKLPVAHKRSDIIKPLVYEDGKLEGEDLEVVSFASGEVNIKYGGNMSGKLFLLWKDAKEGDELRTKFILNRGGKYKVLARLVKGQDYGKIRIRINGKIILNSINCFDKNKTGNFSILLGTYNLKKGENSLIFELLSDKLKSIGVDYIKFLKANN